MQTPGALADGEKLNYAFGLNVGEFLGMKFVAHSGGLAGYKAELVRLPEQKFSVACLCNAANANPTAYAKQIVQIYLADQIKPRAQGGPAAAASASPPPAAGGVQLSEQELGALAGVYLNRVNETSWSINPRGGKLYLGQDTELVPLGANRFTIRGAPGANEMTFKARRAGERPSLYFVADGGKPRVFEPVESAAYTAAQLSEFAGEYWSEEVDARYTFAVKDGKLMMRLRSRETPLEAVFADAFAGPGLIVRFTRAANGRIDGFNVTTPPARRVRFDKLKS